MSVMHIHSNPKNKPYTFVTFFGPYWQTRPKLAKFLSHFDSRHLFTSQGSKGKGNMYRSENICEQRQMKKICFITFFIASNE